MRFIAIQGLMLYSSVLRPQEVFTSPENEEKKQGLQV